MAESSASRSFEAIHPLSRLTLLQLRSSTSLVCPVHSCSGLWAKTGAIKVCRDCCASVAFPFSLAAYAPDVDVELNDTRLALCSRLLILPRD